MGALLLCFFQASESKSSGVKGPNTRGNQGRRQHNKNNNNARAKNSSKQRQDKPDSQDTTSQEETLPIPSYDETEELKEATPSSKSSGVATVSRSSKSSSSARKSRSKDMADDDDAGSQPWEKYSNERKESRDDDAPSKLKDEDEKKNISRNKQENGIADDILLGTMRLSPFALVFDTPGGIPLTSDYAEAASLTMQYLEPFIFYTYDDALEYFSMAEKRALYTHEWGPQINFEAAIKFIDGAMDLSDQRVLGQIEKAFTEESLSTNYLALLQRSLDRSNPIQQSTRVTFYSTYNSENDEHLRIHVSARGTSSFSTAGAFAGAALILAMSGYLMHGDHNHGERLSRLHHKLKDTPMPWNQEDNISDGASVWSTRLENLHPENRYTYS